jgi:hypothetical protein
VRSRGYQVSRTVRWLITICAALLALAACAGVAYLIVPGDTGNRVLIGTSAGVVVGAVIAAWGASAVGRTAPPEADAVEAGSLAVMLSAHADERTAVPGGLQYVSRRVQGRLVIEPHDYYLDAIRSGGPLTSMKSSSGMWPGFAWPALDVKVTNNTARTVFFYEAQFRVSASRTDPRPIPLVFTGHSGESAYRMDLPLDNLGWGPMDDCVFRFHLEHINDPVPLTGEFAWPRDGDGRSDDRTPLIAAMAEAGVDISRYESARIRYLPGGECALGPFTNGVVASGILEYTQTEPDGTRTRQHHAVRALIEFGDPLELSHAPASRAYQVKLRPDGQDYSVLVPISQTLAAGAADRFLFVLAAERASLHDFTLTLGYNDAEQLDCGHITVELFISKNDVRWQMVAWKYQAPEWPPTLPAGGWLDQFGIDGARLRCAAREPGGIREGRSAHPAWCARTRRRSAS